MCGSVGVPADVAWPGHGMVDVAWWMWHGGCGMVDVAWPGHLAWHGMAWHARMWHGLGILLSMEIAPQHGAIPGAWGHSMAPFESPSPAM